MQSDSINGFYIEKYNVHGIKAGAKTSTCPKCSHLRTKKTDKCASVNWETGILSCFHCGELTQLHTFKKNTLEIAYKRPVEVPLIALSDKTTDYLTNTRGISLSALKALKIREQKQWMPQTQKEANCICFDYFLNEELVNVKYRDGRKNFKLVKDAEKIFYNLDNIRLDKTCIIVEGEFDVLAFATAGYINTVSVPNGFNTHNVNLDYLDNYTEYFENKETIFIAVDNDEAGRVGQKELIRRLGIDKCKIVDFGDSKDANDYLLKHGKEKLANLLATAKDVKFEGIYTAYDAKESMLHGYRHGQRRGTTTYTPMDKAWTWRDGEVNVWTGYENEGKSLLVNQLCAIRAYWENAKVAVFSPENFPVDDFYNDIIEMFIGKSCDPHYAHLYMSEPEFLEGLEFCQKNFFLIYPDKDFLIESIFERTKFLIKKNGIKTLLIDPYNTIEHLMKPGEREDLYISRFMAQLKRFAVEENISVNLVAHQNTPKENEKDGRRYFKPKKNNIRGGGTFAAKADNVLTIWRPSYAIDFKDKEVILESQKIKKQKLVGRPQTLTGIDFDIRQNRYLFHGVSPFEKIDRDRKGIEETLPESKPKPYEPDVFELNQIDEDDVPF